MYESLNLLRVTKRDGKQVNFDRSRIERAISLCLASCDSPDSVVDAQKRSDQIDMLTNNVLALIESKQVNGKPLNVEVIQDYIETVLILMGLVEESKHFILYRAERTRIRNSEGEIPQEIRDAYRVSSAYFPTQIQEFQFLDKNARWSEVHGRREMFPEAIERSVLFLRELAQDKIPEHDLLDITEYMLRMQVWPSMRLFSMAGEAARRNNVGIYNCSYLPIIDLKCFSEALLISMAGCGVGYSVEQHNVEQLPRVIRQKNAPKFNFTVKDTTEGWGEAIDFGFDAWFNGYDVVFDLSQLRPAGSILRVKGGRASGPEPLRELLEFCRARILSRQGTVLRPIDAHHIMTKIGGAAVSGGMRRTAMICLYDPGDLEMRHCKQGDLASKGHTHLWNANNSEAWPEEGVSQLQIMRQMIDMMENMDGEPGIFSRQACVQTIPARRKKAEFGMNPCGEIILRPFQFCNLSIVVAKPEDTEADLRKKVRLATIIGTIQAKATYFPGLRDQWRINCEEEALLGVDITGQMDSPVVRDPAVQTRLRAFAREINVEYAELLGIKPSAAITCVKPSGNSSVLFGCSPGLHALWAKYFIRRARISRHSPMFKLLRDAGVPMNPENGQTWENFTTAVVEWPCRAPEGAITRGDRTAMEQLEYWLQVKTCWTEHNPSATIYYKPHEASQVLSWVVKNAASIGGLTFLPDDGGNYQQAPYSEITREEFLRRQAEMPQIDFSKLWRLEKEDYTTASQELACFGGACEVML